MEELAGEYGNEALWLSVRQEDYRILVSTPRAADRELRRVGEWRFEDGCGVTYQFSLSMDQLGTSLEISTPHGLLERYRQIRA